MATGELPRAPRHAFNEKLNGFLREAGFDGFVEELCEEYYATNGRPTIPSGVFFRMVLIGYFEDINSQRGIAWRCEDSRSLPESLGFALNEETPDHSSLSRIKGRLPLEVFQQVFTWVLALVREHKLLVGGGDGGGGLDDLGSGRGDEVDRAEGHGRGLGRISTVHGEGGRSRD